MDDKNLHAIFVASPSGFHCKQIKRSLDTGFHVFSGLYLLRCDRNYESCKFLFGKNIYAWIYEKL
ncbi:MULTISPECIES: hypothetical protein [Clostridium]|uniref:hypothetical protein n=1 Tax=Clostridium TaxID=1485 RepID=UPI0003A5ED86|nr:MULTISPECIES: hypothetical protein [Clostridium]